MVRTLAVLMEQRLLEFPMNSDTDAIDLLGGYEQVRYVYSKMQSIS